MAWERNVFPATEQTSILTSSPNGKAGGGGVQCLGEQIHRVRVITVLSKALLRTYCVPGQSWLSGPRAEFTYRMGTAARRRPRWPPRTLAQ